MSALAEILANGSFWVAVLRIATPLILGTLGVLWCERAHHLLFECVRVLARGHGARKKAPTAFASRVRAFAPYGAWA